jgi:tetratricopeptide (TPR) repeat protein
MDVADEARAVFQRARTAAEEGRYGDAIAGFDEIAGLLGDPAPPELEPLAAEALYGKAYSLERIEREHDALAIYRQVVERYHDAPDGELRRQTARALLRQGNSLARLGQTDEALAIWEDVVTRYEDDADPDLGRRVAGALDRRAAAMRRLERLDEAIDAYDEIVVRFTGSDFPALRRRADVALSNKAFVLLVDGRVEEAIVVAGAAVARLGATEDPSGLAIAVLNLGGALVKEERLDEALNVYDTLIERLETAAAPERQWHLILAVSNKVEVLAMLGRSQEAVAVHQELVQRFGVEVPKAFADAAARNEHDEAAVGVVAGMLLKQAVVLAELGRGDESLIALNDLIGRFGSEEGEDVERVLGMARDFRQQLLDDED